MKQHATLVLVGFNAIVNKIMSVASWCALEY